MIVYPLHGHNLFLKNGNNLRYLPGLPREIIEPQELNRRYLHYEEIVVITELPTLFSPLIGLKLLKMKTGKS